MEERGKQSEPTLSRRGFLTGAATSAGMFALGSMAASAGTAIAYGDEQWDKETDILVIGSGTGTWGALYAAMNGEKVMIVDKAETFGGTAKLSEASFYLPCNPYMVDEGLEEDDPKAAADYLCRINGGTVDRSIIERFVDDTSKFFDLNEQLGISWATSGKAWQDEYDFVGHKVDGGRAVSPLIGSIDVTTIGGAGGGAASSTLAGSLWSLLQSKFEECGGEMLLGTCVKHLLTDDSGEVIGVVADSSDGTEVRIKAHKGVLLATGGFDYNKGMRKAFLKVPLFYTVVVPDDTGDGHIMGLELGAGLNAMSSVCASSSFVPDWEAAIAADDMEVGINYYDYGLIRGKPNCLIVNSRGKRFFNEGAAEVDIARCFEGFDCVEQRPNPNAPATFICDSTFVQYYSLSLSGELTVPDYFKQADTLDEIADMFGIDREGLKDQVETFNEYARQGVDPDFHKGESQIEQWTLCDNYTDRTDLTENRSIGPVETPPFYACSYGLGSFTTSGGLLTDASRQVLRFTGEAIPRLFASGVCGTLITAPGYQSGIDLACGSVTAITAVDEIAKLDPLA